MIIDIKDPQDRAFCDLLQGCTVHSTTFRSGWVSPPEPMRIVGYQLVSLTPKEPAAPCPYWGLADPK